MNEWQGKKFEDDSTQEGLGNEPDQVSLTLETLEAIVAWVKERHNA